MNQYTHVRTIIIQYKHVQHGNSFCTLYYTVHMYTLCVSTIYIPLCCTHLYPLCLYTVAYPLYQLHSRYQVTVIQQIICHFLKTQIGDPG